jgi:SAM-dependent methyltransferase
MAMTQDPSNLDPLRRFSDRVGDYVRYRPSYPAELIGHLQANAGLAEATVVADVGSGTGIFTRLLLETGATVFAVEPNDGMRGAAEAGLGARANFRSVKGTAEATGLADGSVSLVTSAQAFHWFEAASARREFLRILTRNGWCALIWNTAITGGSDFAAGYERIKEEYGTDFRSVRHETIEKTGRLDAFFGAGNWDKHVFGNSQTLDFAGLRGRLLSSSYAPKEGHPRHGEMVSALRELFERCQEGGAVRMDYRTELFLGRLR